MNQNNYTTIKIEKTDSVATVTIIRPEVHNAFNEVMILEMIDAFKSLSKDNTVRVIVLTGEGKSFCAGADIVWMQKMQGYTYDENIEDAEKIFDMMYTIDICPKPVIAKVNGGAMGGGAGLISVCDIAVASDRAKFMLSNTRYGLFPACISPFLVRKIGKGNGRNYFLTGELFDAETALKIGLVNDVVVPDELDTAVKRFIDKFLKAGPETLRMCKELIHHADPVDENERNYHAKVIADMRMSEDGKKGFAAFFEKRK
ncbi:MAG: enoyl-CoA hydratase/isomerase family protein [bacterium]|nr:enoyl-CoA hydratase/isomerase family protein [bacterium]